MTTTTHNEIDLDSLLDYKALYSQIVQKARITGSQMLGLCPVHQEKTPSFSVDLKTGKCNCFSCQFSGNYISLYAKMHGIDQKEAYKAICQENGIDLENKKESPAAQTKKKDSQAPEVYTLDDYAKEKKLPLQFLKDFFYCDTYVYKNGGKSVKMPYVNSDGKEVAVRYRHHPKSERRFSWNRGAQTTFYGLQFFNDIKEKERPVILCEGESDTQTLILLGFDALGVPGASNFKKSEVQWLKDLKKIYMHVEPDRGGEVFKSKIIEMLREVDFQGQLFSFSCNDKGEKDPSGLFIAHGAETATEEIKQLIERAQKVDLHSEPVSITGAPINLRIPFGYTVDDSGIWKEPQKENESPVLVIKTPLMIAKRLVSFDSEEEKVQILFKRDGKLIGGVFDRKTVFNNTSILELTSMGATISSSNAKNVVNYLTKLEEENLDLIPVCNSAKTLGWLPNGGFLPYYPNGVELDAHGSLSQWSTACKLKGNLESWVDVMKAHRERYRFRFLLAASFTAPLLKILKCRSFIVYNWASSRGGKTAALKAALSVWGDPEKMMVTFNSTRVALERMASFFCDIPLGIDERQLAGSNQEGLETLFYMLSNGTSRGRGTRDGGIQEISTWRTVAITTGEEPVAKDNTMTGVSTRTLEIVGAPFESESDASAMHRETSKNYGKAGEAWIKHLQEGKEEKIIELFNLMKENVQRMAGDRNGSHIDALSAVAVADIMTSSFLFGDNPNEAAAQALNMLEKVLSNMKSEELPDVNVSACSYLLDYFQSNEKRAFSVEVFGAREGWEEVVGGWGKDETAEVKSILWIPSSLRKALEDGGFSYRKTLKYMKDEELIECDASGNPSKVIFRGQKSVRVIKIKYKEMNEIIAGNGRRERQEELPF